MKTGNEDNPDQLLQKVLQEPQSDDVTALLKAFFHGYPVERLRKLLDSQDASVVEAGAFILSELGARACPLLADTVALLAHPSFRTRSMALDCVLVCATSQHGSIIADAERRIRDQDEVVRYFAINFLSRCSEEQLRAACESLEDEDLKTQVSWLLAVTECEDYEHEVRERLLSADSESRRFGVVAAIRVYSKKPSLLELAATNSDAEVREAAADRLQLLTSREE